MSSTPKSSNLSARDSFKLAEVRAIEELADLRTEWQDLWVRSGQSPFQSPMWLMPWGRHFTATNLVALAIRADSNLIAVGVFYSWRDERGSKLLLAGNGVSDYLDVCVDPGYCESARSGFERWLREGAWDFCEFNQLPPTSVMRELEFGGLSVVSGDRCPVLNLRRKSASNYAPPRQLEKLRYYRRRAEKFGRVEIEAATTANCGDMMNELFQLHALRWSGRGEPGVLDDIAIQEFHREASANFARVGRLRLYSLRLDSEVIGVLYAFANSSSTYFYLSGFDPRFEKISPGTILIGHAIEYAIAEGQSEFNFLRGAEPYKFAWGAEDQPTLRCLITRVP